MAIKYKYFATYHGPSYGSDLEYVMGFRSLAEAKDAFCDFYAGRVDYQEFRENADGYYVPWQRATVSTPGTTREDYMDLYCVAENTHPGEWILNEYVAYRLTWGERGGVKVEKV